MSIVIKDRDKGFNDLLQTLRNARAKIHVGVDDRPHYPDATSTRGLALASAPIPKATPTDDIARAHELGIGVPERSFLRAWIDHDTSGIRAAFKKALRPMITSPGVFRWGDAMDSVGDYGVAKVKQLIQKNIPPPLSERTVAEKERLGVDQPETALIRSGQLLNAVVAEVYTNSGDVLPSAGAAGEGAALLLGDGDAQ
jgi:hypothetical protein